MADDIDKILERLTPEDQESFLMDIDLYGNAFVLEPEQTDEKTTMLTYIPADRVKVVLQRGGSEVYGRSPADLAVPNVILPRSEES